MWIPEGSETGDPGLTLSLICPTGSGKVVILFRVDLGQEDPQRLVLVFCKTDGKRSVFIPSMLKAYCVLSSVLGKGTIMEGM